MKGSSELLHSGDTFITIWKGTIPTKPKNFLKPHNERITQICNQSDISYKNEEKFWKNELLIFFEGDKNIAIFNHWTA